MQPTEQIKHLSVFKKFRSNITRAETEGAPLATLRPKKCKLSGLTGLELQMAFKALLKLKSMITYKESEEVVDLNKPACGPEIFKQQVDMMISMLGEKLEGPQVWFTQLWNGFHTHSPCSCLPFL